MMMKSADNLQVEVATEGITQYENWGDGEACNFVANHREEILRIEKERRTTSSIKQQCLKLAIVMVDRGHHHRGDR